FLWLGLGAPSGQNGQGDEAAARDALGCFARRLFRPALTAYGHLPFAVFMASPSLAAVTVDMISSPLVSWMQLSLYSNLPPLAGFLDWMVQVEQAAEATSGTKAAAARSRTAAVRIFMSKTPKVIARDEG